MYEKSSYSMSWKHIIDSSFNLGVRSILFDRNFNLCVRNILFGSGWAIVVVAVTMLSTSVRLDTKIVNMDLL